MPLFRAGLVPYDVATMKRTFAALTVGTALSMLAAPSGAIGAQEPSRSAISDVLVGAHAGSAAIDVSGHAPSGGRLTVTLLVTYSHEVPDAVMSRTSVVATAAGTFAATLPLAPANLPGSIITVYVTSATGSAMRATYINGAPNRGVTVPLEQLPRSVQ